MRYLTLVLLALVLAIPKAAGQEKAPADALMLDVDGAIGPAVSDFIERGIERAAVDGNRAVILRMDTVGRGRPAPAHTSCMPVTMRPWPRRPISVPRRRYLSARV
jgi:membrane-bound ClpP family serine protease